MINSDHVALIPGASRPVGRAIAHAFGQSGIHLVLPLIDDWPESNAEMIDQFTDCGYTFISPECDLTKTDEVKELISSIQAAFGRLDFLVNNIERGGMPVVHGSYDQPVNKDQWQLEFDTTLRAKWELFQRSRPLILASGGGSVTNISSIAGVIGRSGPASYLFNDGYSCANRSIKSLTETWARETGPSIRVNEVMLGLVQGRHGENTRGWEVLSSAQQEALKNHTLLKRTAHPDEIADIVYYLAVKATYVTGCQLVVDGGYRLGGEQTTELPPGVLS
jgi:3-oxoacyl-[acyl-carrier protein] reductase